MHLLNILENPPLFIPLRHFDCNQLDLLQKLTCPFSLAPLLLSETATSDSKIQLKYTS